jgi:hypothetical protein
MKYIIKDAQGNPINTIVAGQKFVEEKYPGRYELIPETPTPKSKIITKLAFRRRFTAAEKVAIYNAAETNTALKVWLDDLNVAEEVTLDDEELVQGVQYLEAEGVIEVGRAAEILT